MRSIILVLSAAFFAFSCGQTTENTEQQTVSSEEVVADENTTDVDNSAATKMLDNYLKIKEALVESDADQAATAARSLEQVSEGNEVIQASAMAIAQTNDLEIQRSEFFLLSEALYQKLKNEASLGQTIYWQYCPMARDDQGANWLSSEEEIRNPYFGDAMLTCGAVVEEL
jgi:hypothetical protein